MATFIQKYVLDPLEALVDEVPDDEQVTALPDITRMNNDRFRVEVEGEVLEVTRAKKTIASDDDELPEDIDEHSPSP